MKSRLRCLGLVAVTFLLCASAWAKDDLAARIRAAESGLRPAVSVAGEPQVRWTIEQRMAHWKVPGMSIAVVRNGKLAWAKGYGVKLAGAADKVDTDTVFSVGSVSKVGAAAITLRLVDAGRLDLDREVNAYLTRWRVPENMYTAVRPPTLRGILSHTAGFTVHGFPDFPPNEPVPTLLDTLDGRAPAKTEPVRVFYTPGTQASYSGGGITVEQLMIEDVTGAALNDAARQHLFQPLGMGRSTYENPLPASHGNIARAHDKDGKPTALPRGWQSMPEAAASGLWTTPSDFAKLVVALIESYQGGKSSFLSQKLAREMMTEVGRSPFGLGPQVTGTALARRFFHGGSNDSYKAWMEGYLYSGNGLVVFTNGTNGAQLITEVARSVAMAESWPETDSIEVPRIALSEEQFAELVGVYETRSSTESVVTARLGPISPAYEIRRDGAALVFAEAASKQALALTPLDATHFLMEQGRYLATVEFVRGYDGAIEHIIMRRGDYALEARKVSAQR